MPTRLPRPGIVRRARAMATGNAVVHRAADPVLPAMAEAHRAEATVRRAVGPSRTVIVTATTGTAMATARAACVLVRHLRRRHVQRFQHPATELQ